MEALKTKENELMGEMDEQGKKKNHKKLYR